MNYKNLAVSLLFAIFAVIITVVFRTTDYQKELIIFIASWIGSYILIQVVKHGMYA